MSLLISVSQVVTYCDGSFSFFFIVYPLKSPHTMLGWEYKWYRFTHLLVPACLLDGYGDITK